MANGLINPAEVQTVDGRVTEAGKISVGNLTLPTFVDASNLPTADPHVAGQAWSNSGVITVSAG